MSELAYIGQTFVNGLFLSALYALLSLGLVIVYGVMRIGDFAQGAIYTIALYGVLTVTGVLGLSYWLAIIIVILPIALLSWANGLWIYLPLSKRGIGATFIGALGMLLIGIHLLILIFDVDPRITPSPFGNSSVLLLGISISTHKLLLIAGAIIAILTTLLILTRTRLGMALRALSQNAEEAILIGINPSRTRGFAFLWTGLLVGLAGVLMAPIWPFEPFTGTLLILKAFAIAVIGMGRIEGALIAALMVGMSEIAVEAYWRAEFSDLVPFAMLALMLILRPHSLGPEEDRAKGRAPDLGLMIKSRWVKLTPIVIISSLFFLPLLVTSQVGLHLAILIGLFVIVVQGLDLLTGYAGAPSLAQAALLGIGAYTSALLAMDLGLTFPINTIGAVMVTALIAFPIGALAVRLKGHWTSFTFIIGIVITLLFAAFEALSGQTNGLIGIPPISVNLPVLGEWELNPFRQKESYYYLVLICAVGVFAIKSMIINAKSGVALNAIREDEILAKSVGVDVGMHKITMFAISAAFAGLAGSLYSHYFTYIHSDLFGFVESFNFFVMNLVGGVRTLIGPIVGPTFISWFGELTHPINSSIGEITFGVLLILTLVFLPQGIMGGLRLLWKRVRINHE